MTKYNSDNERIKRKYLVFLKEAKRQAEPTIDAVAKALARFDVYTKHRDFKTFNHNQAIAFKRHLTEQTSQTTGEKLSKSTLHATMNYLRNFFQWLAMESGYKSKIDYTDAEYFSISTKDSRIATAKRDKPVPTIEQIKHVLATMPSQTDIEQRNRALVAFTLLTGARDSAIAGVKLKHVNLIEGSVFQDARDVPTKFSKTFSTTFFPVGDDVRHIVEEWVKYLRQDLLFGNDDPVFPATRLGLGQERQFYAIGLERKHWQTASPIRAIFREAFECAGLTYFNPHSFRKTLVQLGQVVCRSPEDFKAWSQNLGHEEVLTTLYSYGEVGSQRQAEIIKSLSDAKVSTPIDRESIEEIVTRALRNVQTTAG